MKRLDQQKNPKPRGGRKGQSERSEAIPRHQKEVHANRYRNRGKAGHRTTPCPVFQREKGGKLLPPKQRKYPRELSEDILIEELTRLRVTGTPAGKAR